MQEKNEIPNFDVSKEQTDIKVRITIQQLNNGYIVRTSNLPIHFDNIEEAAEAVRQGLIHANWPKQKEKP